MAALIAARNKDDHGQYAASSRMSRIRTFVKKVEAAIEGGDKETAQNALRAAQPELARGVARGVLHKNTASRKMSRLSKRVAAL